jgi:hypothetical protein
MSQEKPAPFHVEKVLSNPRIGGSARLLSTTLRELIALDDFPAHVFEHGQNPRCLCP